MVHVRQRKERDDEAADSDPASGVVDTTLLCIFFKVRGSGSHALSKAVIKEALWAICYKTFKLSYIQPSKKNRLVSGTRNLDLETQGPSLKAVHVLCFAKHAKASIVQKEVRWSFDNKGVPLSNSLS